MIVNVVEIFTEYLSVILCEHKIAKKKIALDRYFWMFFLLDLFSILLAHEYREEHGWLMMLVYVNFFDYVKMRLCKKWADALKIFGIMLLLISSMQLLVYYIIKFIMLLLGLTQNANVIGIEVNCIISLLIFHGKKESLFLTTKKMIKSSGFIVVLVFGVLFVYHLYMYKKSIWIYETTTIKTLTGIIGIGLISILLINAENEKKSKAKELQLYKLYNKTFEEAIQAIRLRQHEFDNHINAIRCLQLSIDNPEDLVKAQNEYCDKILNENSFNKILKVQTEPILAGFLYSKFMRARELGIYIIHEVQVIDLKDKIEISEIIEVIGIIFDNAVEALLSEPKGEGKLIVKILQEKEGVSIEIANKSRKYNNNEIEKFCLEGYSTKGENRGIGLTRAKEIIKKYKAELLIENISYNTENFLRFKIIFFIK